MAGIRANAMPNAPAATAIRETSGHTRLVFQVQKPRPKVIAGRTSKRTDTRIVPIESADRRRMSATQETPANTPAARLATDKQLKPSRHPRASAGSRVIDWLSVFKRCDSSRMLMALFFGGFDYAVSDRVHKVGENTADNTADEGANNRANCHPWAGFG